MGEFDDFIGGALRRTDPPGEAQAEIRALARFRRALRREDQEALDDLLVSMKGHWSEKPLAPHLTPFEFTLLAMLLEQQKTIRRLRTRVEEGVSGSPET